PGPKPSRLRRYAATARCCWRAATAIRSAGASATSSSRWHASPIAPPPCCGNERRRSKPRDAQSARPARPAARACGALAFGVADRNAIELRVELAIVRDARLVEVTARHRSLHRASRLTIVRAVVEPALAGERLHIGERAPKALIG